MDTTTEKKGTKMAKLIDFRKTMIRKGDVIEVTYRDGHDFRTQETRVSTTVMTVTAVCLRRLVGKTDGGNRLSVESENYINAYPIRMA